MCSYDFTAIVIFIVKKWLANGCQFPCMQEINPAIIPCGSDLVTANTGT
jgi:hypothetical protein